MGREGCRTYRLDNRKDIFVTRVRIIARLLAAGVAVAIVVLSLTSKTDIPGSTGVDKLDHLLAYAVLALLLGIGLSQPSLPAVFAVAAGCLLYGALLEVLQHLVGRDMDLLDLAFDAAGIALGLGASFLSRITLRSSPHRSTRSRPPRNRRP